MSTDLTKTFTVERTPEQVFDAITNVRGWWSRDIEGRTDALGEEFTYRVPDIHYSKQRITELVPGKRVVWLVLDSYLSFIEDTEEWTGTTVVFDITEQDGGTRLTFTHSGLRPEHECYGVCSHAWGQYVTQSLRSLIETGTGMPNGFEGQEALETAQAAAANEA